LSEPQPPTGVKIILRDGTEIPCDMLYDGIQEDGCHLWRAVAEVDFDNKDVLSAHADVLPPKTGISFPWNFQ
jgi:hypothetical protein